MWQHYNKKGKKKQPKKPNTDTMSQGRCDQKDDKNTAVATGSLSSKHTAAKKKKTLVDVPGSAAVFPKIQTWRSTSE